VIRALTVVLFGLALACSAQAMPFAPAHPPNAEITLVRMGCGPGMVMANGVCVSRHAIRQARRCARWNGGVCARWY
jgi:hypothetical protein